MSFTCSVFVYFDRDKSPWLRSLPLCRACIVSRQPYALYSSPTSHRCCGRLCCHTFMDTAMTEQWQTGKRSRVAWKVLDSIHLLHAANDGNRNMGHGQGHQTRCRDWMVSSQRCRKMFVVTRCSRPAQDRWMARPLVAWHWMATGWEAVPHGNHKKLAVCKKKRRGSWTLLRWSLHPVPSPSSLSCCSSSSLPRSVFGPPPSSLSSGLHCAEHDFFGLKQTWYQLCTHYLEYLMIIIDDNKVCLNTSASF